MIALAIWLLLGSLLLAVLALATWYVKYPDDPWWLPFAAPYLTAWCWAHNARRRPYAPLMAPGITPGHLGSMSTQVARLERSRGGRTRRVLQPQLTWPA